MSDTFVQFRLRDISVLKAIKDFGELYARAVQLQTDGLRDQLQRVLQLANAKAEESHKIDDDAYRRAEEVSRQARERFDAHLREVKGKK